jgi:hypothetical protein
MSALKYFRSEFEQGIRRRGGNGDRPFKHRYERRMATIHVDGKEYEVDGADNLLQACLSLGLDVPYFCWHPALGSVGACRQCAVKQYANADDKRGRWSCPA